MKGYLEDNFDNCFVYGFLCNFIIFQLLCLVFDISFLK